MLNLWYYHSTCWKVQGKNHERREKDSWSLGQDVKQTTVEYEAGVPNQLTAMVSLHNVINQKDIK
jgi:hypothetical protein